jgi:hypothetical protein
MAKDKPPLDERHRIPLEDWDDYLDVPELKPEEMTLGAISVQEKATLQA